ncbi:hypothetical protein [Tunicatimonas pelagia]|uniref:hypothetical protein n=1 Tax=Tunicatimonas pelagia TaxID=931531 RepID=UPI002666313F|nr:hypothetical protein [Tunicatimonas pelagia]WKN42762.1 hypothetical protein P0M28_27370 [Tunicatimonas pelagia]
MKTVNQTFSKEQLVKYWTVIGIVLLVASVAQPIVASLLSDIPPEELLSPMTSMMGNRPMPEEVTALFAGVFSNIEFSLAFAALKLLLGTSILLAVRSIDKSLWARKVLEGVALFGIAAFVGIGLFFVYSSFVIASAMDIPIVMTIVMSLMGLVVAYFPVRWLWKNYVSLRQQPQVAIM